MNNLLITGGCGFIGSNFIHYVLGETDFSGRIVNVDLLTYAGNLDNLQGLKEAYPERYFFEKIDICDREALEQIFDRYGIDTVCHFAAETHVDRSIVGPDAFILTNVIGTFNLLELVRKRKDRLRLFHHVSTDEVFGSLRSEGYFTETTAYQPNSPYSAAKASSDHLVRAYHKTYGIPVTISNCSNNYGPYQFPEKLIPLMILNALERKALPVYGDGSNVRDWLYVRDHCVAIWEIMTRGERGQTYNVGGDNEMTNLAVVHAVCDALDELRPDKNAPSRRELITFVKDRPGHDFRYAIDFSKLHQALGWSPAESFESGILKTVRWYLDNEAWVERVKSGAYQQWIREQYNS